MTIVVDDGWIDDAVCTCGEMLVCDCIGGEGRIIVPDEVVDRMMTDEKFYDNIVGWF